MTNGWIDIKNTDMMLIMGGNPAENHPCGFKWAVEAKIHRNAKTIVVDPRLTRTAANADLYLQIRAGADIAFLGGVINYAIANNRIAHDYLVNYTNAAFIIKDGFKLPDDGLYSGFDPEKKVYDKSTWNYEEGGDLTGKPVMPTPTSQQRSCAKRNQAARKRALRSRKDKDTRAPAQPEPKRGGAAAPAMLPPKTAYDLSLQHPRCVFQLLKQQYSRYTPEMVERITGIPKDQFLKAADMFTSVRKDGDMKKVATIIYAVGWTQHSFGTQIIRTAAMLQLMLGNVGRAGGGVNASARSLQHSGRNRYGGNLRRSARLFEDAQSRGHRSRHLFKANHAHSGQTRSLGFDELLVEHAQVCGLVPQGDVRTSRDQRKRFRV